MKTSDQDECVLCCRDISIYAIGACDHPVCYECSTRMRVLCDTNECPICRSNMPMVIYTCEKKVFSNICGKYSQVDKKYQVTFENTDVQKAFQLLLENKCKICEEKFHIFNKLKEHVRRKHDLHYCELCAENLKIFPFERKVYNRKDLARHKRVGDPDETSHRGHPLCEFCDQRYVDSDELFRHLRKEHYFCHFCDADGKHQYYEDYDYLKVHFRKEHFLCEEGNCANEQFVGVFRSEIDLKAHVAVHHSKNKSKAEARQARMLEFEFTFAHHNRSGGSSSPRGGRYHQYKRQNIEENNSRENKVNQQAEAVEHINTQSTLEFPYLSEDGESKSNHVTSVPNTNLNSVTLQSFSRNSVPQRQKKAIPTEDFPALISTTVNVTSEVTNNQGRKFNFSINRQNNVPVRTSNLSIQLSQKSAQSKYSEINSESREADCKQQIPTWVSRKKNSNFDDEFPKLESKKAPVTYTNIVNTTVNNVQNSAPPPVVAVSSAQNSGDQFVIIKSKSKKKKHHKPTLTDNKAIEDRDETDDRNVNKPNSLLQSNYFNLTDQENKDPFRKNMVQPANYSKNYIEEETWQQKVTFGKDDFPPLASSDVIRKPPGFNTPKKKTPPPGFSVNSNAYGNSAPLNISLSTVAQQLVASDRNKINEVENQMQYSDRTYKKPHDFHPRNDKLIERIQEISSAQSSSVFDEFKTESRKFRLNEISAADYHTKCLKILGEKGFYDIFPELICLLPDIEKQQELLDVHRKYQNRQNNSGAVPKQNLLNNQISVCDICCQVLLESDHQSHIQDHQTEWTK